MKENKNKPAPLDVETLWQIQRIGSLALAPSGDLAVCSVASYSMDKNQGSSSLWLLSTRGGAARRLTSCGEKDGQPAWSPAGDRIAFISKRNQQGHKDTTPQLYVVAPDGGEAVRCSDFAPGIESFKWLPDGKRIVFAAWVWPELKGGAAQAKRHKAFSERKETGYASSQAYTRYWDHQVPMGRVLHLLLLDVQTGRINDLFEGTPYELPRDAGGNEVYDASPDGSRIAFVHDPAAEPRLGNRLALAQVRLKGRRRIEVLLDEPAWDFGAPRFSPDGSQLALTAAHVGQHHTALTEPALLQADGGWRLLAPGWDHSLNTPLRWAADGKALYFTAEERGRCPLWRLGLEQTLPSVAQPGGWVQAFDAAAGTLAWVADTASHPGRAFAGTEQPGAERASRLEGFNNRLLKRVRLGDVREVEIHGAGGAPVQMWLSLPPDFDARKKYPITQVIHGGPFAAAGDTFSYRWNAHVFAAAGHVIAQVNYHGSSGFGHAFRHSLIGRQGELELQDIEAATQWLIAQPWADRQRVFATGGSYGGFLVAWINGHVPAWPAGPYRATICHAGVFDRVATFSADSWPQRPLDLAATYWEDMPRVLAQSPHNFAARMNTPTLVIHGAQDFRVPDCNGLAYYNTLKARGVDARLLWFPDENHWVLKPQNSRLWYREFAAWLQAQSPPGKKGRRR